VRTGAPGTKVGADPVDSDADGWTDAEELAANGDPSDPARHPYSAAGRSTRAAAPSRRPANDMGDISPYFALDDPFGAAVHLHDFCDRGRAKETEGARPAPCDTRVRAWRMGP
jgi:hypothetical protein